MIRNEPQPSFSISETYTWSWSFTGLLCSSSWLSARREPITTTPRRIGCARVHCHSQCAMDKFVIRTLQTKQTKTKRSPNESIVLCDACGDRVSQNQKTQHSALCAGRAKRQNIGPAKSPGPNAFAKLMQASAKQSAYDTLHLHKRNGVWVVTYVSHEDRGNPEFQFTSAWSCDITLKVHIFVNTSA